MKKFKVLFIILLLCSLFTSFFTPSVYAAEEESEKVIYLTFDDGPGGKVTEEILDTLKKEEIPATFFLIGNQIKGQEELVKRIQAEGHSLGLHSMSHKKSILYSSNDNFLKEMLESQSTIKEVTGEAPIILRFPFGCNNSCYKLKKTLVELLHENNFKIYDWNVDTTDGANYSAAPSRFIKQAKSDNNPAVLLMHCGNVNKNSAEALPDIIKYYKNKGYTFKKIAGETPEVFHYISN